MISLKLPIDRNHLTTQETGLPAESTDVLVIGSGIAGLEAALVASRRASVTIVTKDEIRESNTRYAQGGIAAVLSREHEELQGHINDTLKAGCGLCDEKIVRLVINEGPVLIRELIQSGMQFDKADGDLLYTREGGHSSRRILHSGGDKTGEELEKALVRMTRTHQNIKVLEHTFAVDLLVSEDRCCGAIISDQFGKRRIIYSKAVILASGGVGQVYRETTNPPVATGDGLAMALRAGVEISNMEFVQFHPTTLYIAGAARALITEAVRGEGGVLIDTKGHRFMPEYHPMADLAPRDVVSRSILAQIRKVGEGPVYIDMRHLDVEKVHARFPHIVDICASFGINVPKDLIPVSPSAHYMIGGVKTDDNGVTTLPGFYACGEAADTGFHGANRLGSNSLLESLVFGKIAGEHASANLSAKGVTGYMPDHLPVPAAKDTAKDIDVPDAVVSLRSLMWRYVGVERDGAGLEAARQKLNFWSQYIGRAEFPSPPGWQLQNMLQVSRMIVESALLRTETRGVHYRIDFPERDDTRWNTNITVARELER